MIKKYKQNMKITYILLSVNSHNNKPLWPVISSIHIHNTDLYCIMNEHVRINSYLLYPNYYSIKLQG